MTAAKIAVTLERVSSKDQEDGYSLDVQADRLTRYCLRKELDIVKRFSLVESSTKGDRVKFMEIIKFIKKQREPVALVADKVDRIQRSQKETPLLDELIRKGKLELHFNSEGYVIHQESTAHERMMWGIGVVIAQSHTDILSENVKKSLKQKTHKHGEWYGKAPLGYLNKRDEKDRGYIITDPVRAPIIQKFFEEYATGAYTLGEMVKKVKEWGLRTKKGNIVSKSVMYRILTNPFYYGTMIFRGEHLPHCHEALISKATFLACEAVREGWNKKKFVYAGKDFLFRGVLTCATTGNMVTADHKKKTYKNGTTGEWTYLRCWNPEDTSKKIWAREDDVKAQVEDVLKNLGIKSPEVLADFKDYVLTSNEHKKREHNEELGDLKQEHSVIQTRLDSMIDLVADGTLTREEFLKKKRDMKDRQHEITQMIKVLDHTDDEFSKKVVDLMNIASYAYETYLGSTLEEKREFLQFIFANLQLRGKKIEYALRYPFSEFENMNNCNEWR